MTARNRFRDSVMSTAAFIAAIGFVLFATAIFFPTPIGKAVVLIGSLMMVTGGGVFFVMDEMP